MPLISRYSPDGGSGFQDHENPEKGRETVYKNLSPLSRDTQPCNVWSSSRAGVLGGICVAASDKELKSWIWSQSLRLPGTTVRCVHHQPPAPHPLEGILRL